MTTSERPRYCSYLLRLWHAGDSGASEWRITLEDVHTRERRAFADLDSLAAYLEQQMAESIQLGKPAHLSGSTQADQQP